MNTWKLAGAVVPVSGAASGIGLEICRQLRAAGALPLLLDLQQANLDEALAQVFPELDPMAASRHAYVVDVRSSQAVDDCFSRIREEHGRVTHAVANAGVSRSAHILELSDADWRGVLDVNLDGVLYFCRAAARQLVEARGGSIVAMASLAGLVAKKNRVAYASSKAAVINMTRALAIDLGEFGIRVNAVAPGMIDTPMQTGKQVAAVDQIIRRCAIGRMGTASEVAHAALFLLSDYASYITGHTLVVDGGVAANYG